MNTVYCNECKNKFALDEPLFHTIKKDGLTVQYFVCPHCGMKYHVFTADAQMQELEPIPKLAMNLNELTPDNNSAGKLEQGHVVGSFLFITNQEFAETIEKRVCNLNNPASCAKVRVAFQLFLFLTAGPNMRNIIPLFNRFPAAGITRVQTQILRVLLIRFWTRHYNVIQSFRQQFDVMRIRSRNNNCQREPLFIRQNTAFCPHFFLGPLGSFQRTPKPRALLSYNRPDFATPSLFLPAHRTVPDLCSKSFQRNLLPAIPETFCVLYCRFRTPGAVPSTGSQSAAHKISPPVLSSLALVFGLDRGHFCIPFLDPALFSEFLP